MDAMHRGLLNKMRGDKVICNRRDTSAGDEIKPSLSMQRAFCPRVSRWPAHVASCAHVTLRVTQKSQAAPPRKHKSPTNAVKV